MNDVSTPRQLSLLPASRLPLQFRLDAETRRRGLRHIAEIRQQLDARRTAQVTDHETADRSADRAA